VSSAPGIQQDKTIEWNVTRVLEEISKLKNLEKDIKTEDTKFWSVITELQDIAHDAGEEYIQFYDIQFGETFNSHGLDEEKEINSDVNEQTIVESPEKTMLAKAQKVFFKQYRQIFNAAERDLYGKFRDRSKRCSRTTY
jgi:hypothetical protein